MSDSIIPSFLPPPYDFTTEYDDTEEEEEYDDTEEEEEEYNKGSLSMFSMALFYVWRFTD